MATAWPPGISGAVPRLVARVAAAAGCSASEPLGHLGKALREFTIDPKDKSKISLKILHFPLPVA